MACYFAVDLGATSGRTIVGRLEDGRLTQEVVTRFPNSIIHVCGHYYWDIYALYGEVLRGLRTVRERGIEIESIGVDTWGCDFCLIGSDGAVLRNPLSYRDPHTTGIEAELFRLCPKEEIYGKTGIEFMYFNSLFQLLAMRRAKDAALEAAQRILFMPDALIYLLTGEAVCERTILSTSQLLNAHTGRLDEELLELVGLKAGQFGRRVEPGEVVGALSREVQDETGWGPVPVVAVAGHDTGAAVAAIPAENERFAYLSCGTWSLLGIESPRALINDTTYSLSFTNEAGIEGTTCVLKNICGLWLLERCRKDWEGTDVPTDINEIVAGAAGYEGERVLIEPDADDFKNPLSMTEAISNYLRKTGQAVPADWRGFAACIFHSLARRYKEVVELLQQLAPMEIETLHVVGGGSLNAYLMQLTADATGLRVVTGPVECTAMGNLLLQAKAQGRVADRFAMRRIVARSSELREYQPSRLLE